MALLDASVTAMQRFDFKNSIIANLLNKYLMI